MPLDMEEIVAVANGSTHALALRADGTVRAWGYLGNTPATAPASLTGVVSIAASWGRCVALKRDGSAVAWSPGSARNLSLPESFSSLVEVADNGQEIVGLKTDGTVVQSSNFGWLGSAPPVGLSNVVTVGAGGFYGAALIGDPAPVVAPEVPVRFSRIGSFAFFHPKVLGARPMSFQWRFNGLELPGQTNAWLALRNLMPADAGRYSLSASNQHGVTSSADLSLLVAGTNVTPPRLTFTQTGAGRRFELRVVGDERREYDVYSSSNLMTWQFAGVLTNDSRKLPLPLMATNRPGMFYRARLR